MHLALGSAFSRCLNGLVLDIQPEVERHRSQVTVSMESHLRIPCLSRSSHKGDLTFGGAQLVLCPSMYEFMLSSTLPHGKGHFHRHLPMIH